MRVSVFLPEIRRLKESPMMHPRMMANVFTMGPSIPSEYYANGFILSTDLPNG
jgi:hypothetical protein